MSSTKFVFFGPIGKTRWPPWPLIGWDIFDFSSETAQRNSKKLDRKQDLNVLYQVCVFRADRKNKMAALALDWLRHFRLLLLNRWMEFNETWEEATSQRLLPSLYFSGRLVNKNFRPGWSVKKVAHCTQVHDMWPFGPSCSFFADFRGGGASTPPPSESATGNGVRVSQTSVDAPCVLVNISCEVSSLYVKRKWRYHAKVLQSLKSEFDLDLWTPNSIGRIEVNRLNIILSKVIVQKPLFHRWRDGCTVSHSETGTHPQFCWQGYKETT